MHPGGVSISTNISAKLLPLHPVAVRKQTARKPMRTRLFIASLLESRWPLHSSIAYPVLWSSFPEESYVYTPFSIDLAKGEQPTPSPCGLTYAHGASTPLGWPPSLCCSPGWRRVADSVVSESGKADHELAQHAADYLGTRVIRHASQLASGPDAEGLAEMLVEGSVNNTIRETVRKKQKFFDDLVKIKDEQSKDVINPYR